ncbi:hypothetical protein DEU56DRAFT_277742 [Suillus clintonianus]|uniref:uncharacterized protein n=1 Tax=Suillus clintonianus TaxID=1904413 RepID=UPI001B863E65|nr:uncharacterized protein DEU56DRAFT_277742 [Suillus clintonianus]KAG2141354.1 hypothetical protein DEU56DRAFT_277742 [Suillus clintonianus]
MCMGTCMRYERMEYVLHFHWQVHHSSAIVEPNVPGCDEKITVDPHLLAEPIHGKYLGLRVTGNQYPLSCISKGPSTPIIANCDHGFSKTSSDSTDASGFYGLRHICTRKLRENWLFISESRPPPSGAQEPELVQPDGQSWKATPYREQAHLLIVLNCAGMPRHGRLIAFAIMPLDRHYLRFADHQSLKLCDASISTHPSVD